MGLLSSRASITCYRVEGKLAKPVTETVEAGLKQYAIRNIDNDPAEKAVGWTAFATPFVPAFSKASFMFGHYMIFALRLDKKAIPAKVVKKYCMAAYEKQMKKTGQATLAKNEKKQIKEKVLHELVLRVPATPNAYDIVWDYEAGRLWFFSNMKGANEELETLFVKTFSMRLIRLFPYTIADLEAGLSDSQRDRLFKLSPTNFMES
ncbi:MAG: recombination-associated protein RdgC [Thermodesulfobacteriota bacterium]|nr:recombination-associated protein RdgC [Thermodesulfobacteriota bacterium]